MKKGICETQERHWSKHVLGIIVLCLLSANMVLNAAIPAIERKALIALYNAAKGDTWWNNNGWKDGELEPDGFGPIGSEGSWAGVVVINDHVGKIGFGDNHLVGYIPTQLEDLSQLTYLALTFGGLIGNIPSEIGKLTNLKVLRLCGNVLTGNIPSELGNLTNLTELSLFDNLLTGSIPAKLGNLRDLKELYLTHNRLTGNIPSTLGNLSELELLHLETNQLDGQIPSELGGLSKLRHFYLGSNQLTGSIPLTLINLKNLEFINLSYNALYTNNEAFKIFLNKFSLSDWESTQTIAPSNISATTASLNSIRLSWTPIIYCENSGCYRIYYRQLSGSPWIYYGETKSKNDSFCDVSGLIPGTWYKFKIQTQTDPNVRNSCQVLSEFSDEITGVTGSPLREKYAPFGAFETPIEGLIARGSIPVTGWALDDTGIDSVKIYRQLGQRLVYIGDGVFVEGARPDVAFTFPDYPNNTQAGWGYMLLTNFLPNNGNGTFILHAIATDMTGKTTTLGTKTIHCDNENAVKPFGAIDTPAQGDDVSGNHFVNYGWALTPQPNKIPIDGSTITVWVDGVPLGNPVYNQYRDDIASLFPNYNNSDGAVGYFYLDTTNYINGLHTIQWSVKDDAGNSSGIGSRYFTIRNVSGRLMKQTRSNPERVIRLEDIPRDFNTPITYKTGYNRQQASEEMPFSNNGTGIIEIPQMERIELNFGDKTSLNEDDNGVIFEGYQIIGEALAPLPVGSYLDRQHGVFYWQTGTGFLGHYHLVFIKTARSGDQTCKEVIITIQPQQ